MKLWLKLVGSSYWLSYLIYSYEVVAGVSIAIKINILDICIYYSKIYVKFGDSTLLKFDLLKIRISKSFLTDCLETGQGFKFRKQTLTARALGGPTFEILSLQLLQILISLHSYMSRSTRVLLYQVYKYFLGSEMLSIARLHTFAQVNYTHFNRFRV